MKKFWIVVKDGRELSAVERHPTYTDADVLAKHLAEIYPGSTFIVMEAVGCWRPSSPPVIFDGTTYAVQTHE